MKFLLEAHYALYVKDAQREQNKIREQDLPVHDWYRFVLSYPPHLVAQCLKQYEIEAGQVVLDPFAGTGTTLVEAQKHGITSVGIEAWAFAAFAAGTKLRWNIPPEALRSAADKTAAGYSATDSSRNHLTREQQHLLVDNSISERPLRRTLGLLQAISEHGGVCRGHLRLALARELPTGIGNLRFGPEVGLGKIKEDAPVLELWHDQAHRMADDLECYRGPTDGRVILGDARDPQCLMEPSSVDAVITSPPYPNEKDYTRASRLESVLLGYLSDRKSLRAAKQALLRSNSRTIYKGDTDDLWAQPFPEIRELAERIEDKRVALGKTSGFERAYHKVVLQYFGGMVRHLEGMKTVLMPDARLAYVVGDQASFFRILIRTGSLLGDIAQRLGYELVDIELFRTRTATTTKQQINEEIVHLRWPGLS